MTFPEQRESLMSLVVEALMEDVSGFPIQTKTVKGLLLYDVPGLHISNTIFTFSIKKISSLFYFGKGIQRGLR
jgi:hypothetical protein